jgi:endonuclease YncB( thermonuclease family)
MRPRRRHYVVALATAVVAASSACAPLPPTAPPPTQLVHVVDGDTVRVAARDGDQETVRLIGVNTPRRGGPAVVSSAADARRRPPCANWPRTARFG